jgi:cation transporter-like permease
MPSIRAHGRAAPAAYTWLWLGPLLFMLAVGLYFVSRYAGRWAEADTATFTQYIRQLLQTGRLAPVGAQVYPNGYAYQAISAFIVATTGLDVAALQQLVYPLVAALIVLPAWLLYRELTGSARGAALATMLLLTQPEFLFVSLRSSHEKFTRTLLLLCLYLLTHSFKLRNRPWAFAIHVGLFYLCAFALIASNNLLAHSFIFAVAVALALAWLLERRGSTTRGNALLQRLPYAMLICLGLDYLFTFYSYPPAQHDLLVLRNIWERIAALLLDVQTRSTNPYIQVAEGWVSLPVYFTVSLANWLVLGVSFAIWARQGWRWLRTGQAPSTPTALLLWLLYASFALQGALTVAADASGALSSNLQHRIFPSFAIVAVGVVGARVPEILAQRPDRRYRYGLAGAIACLAVLAAFKASNEPILSNKWTFYRDGELAAIAWSDAHLRDATVWTEFDERLTVALMTARGELLDRSGTSANGNRFTGHDRSATVREYLLTDVTRLRASRLREPLPAPADALRVYDNGMAELYHARPQTPYQK